ncbi:MAG: CFI-box-CTERM domain-containing protein [Thermodesulfovibrionia bacterium]|nr:CFI-box-CTERM domain-containing protein [Thermodesulfovibrionia bacterium]
MPKLNYMSKLYLIVILFFAGSLQIADVVYAVQGETTRVSIDSAGVQGNSHSWYPSISADGRYVAFESEASNLVAGDTNGLNDVFVHDRFTGETSRVSIDSSGAQGNNISGTPSISADGRYAAFISDASNLIAGDTNGFTDVFVHDRTTGQTTRVSIDSSGVQGNNESWWPSISADGRYVAFESDATNLVAGDTNGFTDVFVHDRTTGQTTRVSIDSSGVQGNRYSWSPSISADGRYVAFESDATYLVAGDTNGTLDVFVHDRTTGLTTRVSIDSSGAQSNRFSWSTSISADGRYIAINSDATNLVAGDTNGFADVFVHDRTTGQTTRVSIDSSGTQGNSHSWFPYISSDGRYVAFGSDADNLVEGDTNGFTDILVHDRTTGQTSRVSIDSSGAQGNSFSWSYSISADGRYIAINSDATNLVAEDTNGSADIFVHDFLGETPGSGGGSSGCFIATAAYGSYFEPHVKVLRDFRDKVLLKNSIGNAFVKFYYTGSPPIADLISRHESLQLATRLALTPLVYAVKYPGVAALTLLGLVITPFIRKRKHAGKIY